jgi:hypothetical protein
MVPLAAGICMDFYLAVRMILKDAAVVEGAAAFGGLFPLLCFVLPRVRSSSESLRAMVQTMEASTSLRHVRSCDDRSMAATLNVLEGSRS